MTGMNLKFLVSFSALDLLIQLILVSMEELSPRIVYGYY